MHILPYKAAQVNEYMVCTNSEKGLNYSSNYRPSQRLSHL
jgi:hypothetical protein